MPEYTPFLTMFPGLADLSYMAGGLERAFVTDVQVDRLERTMAVAAWFAQAPSLMEAETISGRLRSGYGLKSVGLVADYPRDRSRQPGGDGRRGSGSKSEPPKGETIFGHAIRQRPVKMETLSIDSGRVTVEGDVVVVNNRHTKGGGAVLLFDLTDRTNTVRISQFLGIGTDQSVIDRIGVGDHLIVQGEYMWSKWEDDMVLVPKSIMKGKKLIRRDEAPEKRVELHMHTRFSALDALTDPEAIVKRAAYWGMPAVAVTDHGVAQAFPDMWKAGKKHGVKIIYGMEAYYQDDMDGNAAVIGKSKLPLDTEFVAFDIETTGLNAQNDRMTEIGAVIFSGGEIRDTFNTFVDPGMHIPANITELTGIRDSDVAGAPDEKTAMEMFLRFAGDRPLIAHNAHFDVGFMTAAARRQGLRFMPVFLDTLALSQALLPELKRFRLDIVSKHLELPPFDHHRASDDAMVVARIMEKFLPMLRRQGAKTVDDIETVYHELRRTDVAKTYHMVLLVKDRKGLKNLYEMISQSYLKYFHRSPIVPKSLLLQHREGIL
ncbi:MAG: PHP domain-containing protein, partial [Oscillospiraceae bacterium]|nr:PHP domain-containing protein [Oscillospiraceae bacterium]